jgi:hypothetical protein
MTWCTVVDTQASCLNVSCLPRSCNSVLILPRPYIYGQTLRNARWQSVIIRHLSGTYTLVGITTTIFADKKLPPSTSTTDYTRLYYRSYEYEDGGDQQKTEKNGSLFREASAQEGL